MGIKFKVVKRLIFVKNIKSIPYFTALISLSIKSFGLKITKYFFKSFVHEKNN